MTENTSPLPLLFTPIKLRGITARNRVMVSPMCQYVSEDGGPTDFHLVHLGQFAIGGAGIVFCEETSIEEPGRKTYYCAGIYKDKHVAGYRRINDFLRSHGAIPAMQLGHAGSKGSGCAPWDGYRSLNAQDAKQGRMPWQTISASAVPSNPSAAAPHAMDHTEIKQHIAQWREAALRSLDAGYDIVEVHAAHGYLLHQFLSPMANKRSDGYGGSLEGRMRLCLEIVETVREVWPSDLPVFMRVSATDGADSGWDMDDTVALSRAAKERGVDMMTPSSGGIKGPTSASVVSRLPGYHVAFAERIRKETGLPTVAVGLITEAQQAEQILQNGQADIIALARELLWNPYWPAHAAQELNVPNYLDLLPRNYSWWLARREAIREITRKEQEVGSAA